LPQEKQKGNAMDRLPKILLMEENPLLRLWMREILLQEGFWVVAPSNSEEAIRLASVFTFDVLISNWQFSGGYDGGEILLAGRSQNPELIGLLVVADEGEGLSERARSAGFGMMIRKPFSLADVLGAVKTLVRQSTGAATR
jgi:DNA-binding response OmpR family regulator